MGFWPDPNHPASWTVESYLLANLIDCVRELTYVTIKLQVGNGQQVKKPDPIHRPGQKKPGQIVGAKNVRAALRAGF